MRSLYDIKYAFRLLLKKPVFSATTIMIMSLGLALSIYCYTLLNTLIYKPLAIQGGEAVVAITGGFDQVHLSENPVWVYVAKQLRDHAQSYSDFSIYSTPGATALISGRGSSQAAQKLNSTFTDWNLFQVAGVQPLMGRVLKEEDNAEGAELVMVLSYPVWQNFFSADPNIIDRVVNIDAEPTRIVGVMPQGFAFPAYAQVWQPQNHEVIFPTAETFRGTDIVARLKPGVTIAQAQAEADQMAQRLKTEFPEQADFINLEVMPFKEHGLKKQMPILAALSTVVFLILLLACINVGNLLLSRVNERIKEVAIRVALGVPRNRLVVQMLWESIIICTIGGLIALLMAAWALEITNLILEDLYSVEKNKPYWWHLSIGFDSLLALLAIVLITILLTGLVPAWRAMTGDFNAVLRDGTRGALSKKSGRISQVLVAAEIILSCVVLIIASMVLTTTFQASKADYGIDTTDSLTAQVELPFVNYFYRGDDEERQKLMQEKRNRFYDNFKYELESQANIISLASMSDIPGTGGGWSYFDVEGREYPNLEDHPFTNNEVVAVGSLKAMGLKLIEGRYFDSRDTEDKNERIIISEALAKNLYPNESAIGKRNRGMRRDRSEFGDWRTIIGVVSNVIHGSAIDTSSMVKSMYHPHTQAGGIGTRFKIIVKYQGSELQAKQTLERTLKRIDPDVPVYNIRSYQRLIEEPMFLISNISKLFLLCGLIAIFLSATGIYAVVSNSISQRTQEIGVRRAVGATDKRVLNLFLSKSGWQLVWGVGLGIVVAIFVTLKMTDMIVIQSMAYSIAYIAIPVLIVSIVLCATYIPANRALRVEPSDALHYE